LHLLDLPGELPNLIFQAVDPKQHPGLGRLCHIEGGFPVAIPEWATIALRDLERCSRLGRFV
jgi:hypothetical protein